ncbi:nucleotide diphosphatase [Aspergillus ibericus CBS 121593]|uniref:Maf-domain-containing protein n=1 Tax=Aspergillus ibericus CBS 121593 TaxID=1448316 RepID=A0A395HB84_9EURO|nr:Maf-domain-containing protein [Aspergillus ibericus CBS 121593]RAL05177.1 Maf-domain-containing protein [Aspergillus ibericus CBS 121593]
MSDSKQSLLSSSDPSTDPPPAYSPSNTTTTTTTTNKRASLLPRPPPLSLPVLTHLRTKRFILASTSPRRRQILSLLSLPNIEIIPPNTEENLPKTLSPYEYVLQTATKKAQAVYAQEIDSPKGEPAVILAADTIIVDTSTGSILEKPRSEAHHITMLKNLRDAGEHKVYTAVVGMAPLASARVPGYALESWIEETRVWFDRGVSDEVILAYVKTREGADKAGGYGIQGLGSVLVERIEGSYDNVVGLPLRRTLGVIERVVAKADDEDLLDGEVEEDYVEGEDEEE